MLVWEGAEDIHDSFVRSIEALLDLPPDILRTKEHRPTYSNPCEHITQRTQLFLFAVVLVIRQALLLLRGLGGEKSRSRSSNYMTV